MSAHVPCLVCLRRRPDELSPSALRRWIAAHLQCSPFRVRLLGSRPAGPGLLMQASLPSCALDSRSASDPSLYIRVFPAELDVAQRALLFSTLAHALIRLFDETETQRVFLGRPLIVAAERTPPFVRLYRFSRRDWETFAFRVPSDRELTFRQYLCAQSLLADLLRMFGRRVRLELGCGFEVALGDAASL